jgi:hypothetical protein
MTDDPRCCGSGTCIIDNEGRCWCGQQWDGQKMCHAPLAPAQAAVLADAAERPSPPDRSES